MLWVYLSPHPDDVALSCGGLVWQQVQAGEKVEIWTICAGDPAAGALSPFAEAHHARWNTGREAYAQRRREDLVSCERLGATPRHFSLPECIYRTNAAGNHLYTSPESLFGEIHPDEEHLIEQLARDLRRELPRRAVLVSPMTLGGHVDHRLVRAAAERLHRRLWYYLDFPYVANRLEQLARLRQPDWKNVLFPISDQAITAWADAFNAHASQRSTFWPDDDTTLAIFQGYAEIVGGVRLFRQPQSH